MTPAPISVERLRELLDKATPSTGWVVTYDGFSVVTDDEPMHRIHVASCVEPDDAALIAEAITALRALLQQLAEREAEVERERSRREHTQQWYAERLVKIEEIAKRENLWGEVAAVIANGSGTRQLPDGSYFYDPPTYAQQLNSAKHRAEAAERAREESIQALRAADEWILNAPHGDNCFVSDHCEGDPGNRCNCGRESVLNYIMETRINHDAAFLAASGGA